MESLPRVCLIVPPSVFLLDERVFMSLGILKVASVLERAGYPLDVLDLSGVENFVDVVEDYVRGTDTALFGLTSTTPQMPAASRVATAIRSLKPQARLILGGPHVTLVNAAYRKEVAAGRRLRATRAFESLQEVFDVLVAGDGEDAVFVALGENPPRLVDADQPRSPMFLTNNRLDQLPLPARHLVEVPSYHYQIDGVPALSVIAQLGCPFSCGFCGGRESPSLRRIRTRTTGSILAEIEHIYRTYGMRGFMFYDDELNVSPKMVELMNGLADLQSRLGTDFKLRGFIKSELFTDEQAAAMYRAGFRWILTGFESGSPRILKNINKKATQDENTRCVDIARRHGLKVKALMSLGHPGESEETIDQTRQWLLDASPNDFDVTIITTYPGTPYYDHAEPSPLGPDIWTYTAPSNGDRLHAYEVDYNTTANYYKGVPDGGYQAFVFTDALQADTLVQMRDGLEREIRQKLDIPFNAQSTKNHYEHSMGQQGPLLPTSILRSSSRNEELAARGS